MKTVTVDKKELQEILIKNRSKHQAEYEEAFEGYINTSIKSLEKILVAFKSGKTTKVKWNESRPTNNTKDYDRVIKMLEMSVDGFIELTSDEFANFVQDDWNWKDHWMLSNSKYMTQ